MKAIRAVLGLVLNIILISLLSLAQSSCADDSRFIVRGTTASGNADNFNLRYAYNTPQGYRSGILAVRDGKFEFSGASSQPTLVEMYEHDYKPLGWLWLKGGDRVNVTLTPGHPEQMKATGTDVNKRLSDFLASLPGEQDGRNDAVAAYVTENPGDILSGILMVALFDSRKEPVRADSLLTLIAPEARPELLASGYSFLVSLAVPQGGSDFRLDSLLVVDNKYSVASVRPGDGRATMLVFTDAEAQRTDSLLAAMTRVAALKGATVADIYLATDTISWRRMVRGESMKKVQDENWKRVWLPGNLGEPQIRRLGVTALPCIIVFDSAGRAITRTPDPLPAEEAVSSLIKK